MINKGKADPYERSAFIFDLNIIEAATDKTIAQHITIIIGMINADLAKSKWSAALADLVQ